MLFNSIEFAFFLPVIFVLYWFVFKRNLRLQNFLILTASYVFYGWWDWRFLFLLTFSSVIDYFVAQELHSSHNERKRKRLLWLSLCVNLGLLGTFKYFNFFAESFADAFTLLGRPLDPVRLNIILPVGISFYTFQTLSYTIDVYRQKLTPTKDPVAFFAFVSFFPQLVAGPIERATNLLPQFYKKRQFDYSNAVNGLRQILWGLVKKIVIADNCAEFANQIFNSSDQYSGSVLVLGAIFFTFQIYGDFSGYSDIAIGTSRLFGFDLMKNFAFPYFSRDIAEFWRRWHISLSTWFRDYLYIPLGGSKVSLTKKIRNTFLIFLVSGFWHGANWTFVFWGALNAIYFLPLLLLKRNRKNTSIIAENSMFPSVKELLSVLFTFGLTVFAWIFFRAESLSHAFSYIKGIAHRSVFQMPSVFPKVLVVILVAFILVEWIGRGREFALDLLNERINKPLRWTVYLGLLLVIYFLGNHKGEIEFIYFQF